MLGLQRLLHRLRASPGIVGGSVNHHLRVGYLIYQRDFAGCGNPAHIRLGTNHNNRSKYAIRRRNIASPLADVREPASRTRAVATAIRIEVEQSLVTDCCESLNTMKRPELNLGREQQRQ